jgi:hypothetical protein
MANNAVDNYNSSQIPRVAKARHSQMDTPSNGIQRLVIKNIKDFPKSHTNLGSNSTDGQSPMLPLNTYQTKASSHDTVSYAPVTAKSSC